MHECVIFLKELIYMRELYFSKALKNIDESSFMQVWFFLDEFDRIEK